VAAVIVTRILVTNQTLLPVPVGDVELAGDVAEFARETSMAGDVARAVVGLVLTLGAAEAVLVGATGVAEQFGLDEGLIGLAIVAIGTSLPELVTVITAVRRGEDELVLGNVLGSNLANSLLVGGLATLAGAAGTPVTPALRDGAIVMGVLVLLAAAALGRRLAVSRAEGVLLLVAYAAGLVYVAL
jgi:cation:H+ antiporter